MLGGIRWWCEAIVRGFGVHACDPVDTPCRGNQACAICGLFGKADPASSARFAIRAWTGADKRHLFTKALTRGSTIFLEFHFYRDRDRDHSFLEEYLLVKAMDVISRYGSIGGKTTLKPTRPGNGVLLSPTAKNAWERRHTDYGLLELRTINGVSPTHWNGFQQQFEDEMLNLLQHPAPSNLPALNRFWFAPGITLFVHPTTAGGNDSINNLLGLEDTKSANNQLKPKTWPPPDACNPLREHLRGIPEHSALGLTASSKKAFSFGSMGSSKLARSWGYVLDPRLLGQLPDLLRSAGIATAQVKGVAVLHEPIGG